MAAINRNRVVLGALVGAVVWFLWSGVVSMLILAPRYAAGQAAGEFLKEPRYPYFMGQWFIVLFLVSYVLAWLYASVRFTLGAGPWTALRVGLLVGFAIGFPMSFSLATWSPLDRIFPLWWMLELWVGAILSCFVAGWLYKE